ncbi:uncharacterized protein PFL1_01650 [Pseudozyma flocculosa PF-1]|uniref:Related to NOC4 - nucleolar protein, mediates maturation and nuclear export of 40S ribosomal subunits n=1 Tax=Pseudozyma flocculosa TaxID=84751 RepID=A0A5C3EYP1_9BASI|nr:uncharacterized protein PFL1_01650 [Pseudozyma flocculosa PF-1]EPQ30749.1 hypothetical protein PFL1_01650 [Pseudozyma flocculosa PF-1]SPO36895.1 related to NOC4 - nucleolar protein, mediates maturation and nuclear export of 40S ribosomal subunits [Pseudozyma flocculosa]
MAPSTKKAATSAAAAAVPPAKEAPSELLTQIASLQKALATSSDLNPLADLIAIAKKHSVLSNSAPAAASERTISDRQHSAKAVHRCIHILSRSFKTLCSEDRVLLDNEVDADGQIGPGGGSGVVKRDEAEKAVAGWIRQRWNECIELLCALLNHDLVELRSTSLELLMELQVAASSSLSRLAAAATAHSTAASSSTTTADESRRGQWSLAPWRALIVSLVAGPPSLDKLTNGETTKGRRAFARDEGPAEDVRAKFAENGMQEYDDVRFAALREISTILRKPSPSAARNPSLRANGLSLLLLLTAIPADQADINNFLVDELSIPLASAASAKKGKKKAANGLKVTEDGDSDDGAAAAAEEEVDMEGWFSDSDDEGGNVTKRKGQDKSAVEGLGAAAKAAAAAGGGPRRKRRELSFHEGLHRLDVQKAAFSRAWSDLLLPRRKDNGSGLVGGELSLAATHEILVRLHAQILPHLTRPTMLHDFLVGCLDSKGATALLALNAIFTLVTRHNLDYPQFYQRLYALLDASVLHMRYRSRFLRLLDVFLSSTHLSAALVASFAKRLSRLSLRAPPAAIASVLPFVWNLLKRHPRCLGMIHKEWDNDRLNIGPAGVADPFDPDETDPLKTNAIESSLWELATFGASLAASAPRAQVGSSEAIAVQNQAERGGEQHYLSSVTSLAKILAQPFTKDRYELDDFLDITYGTLFDTETAKTLRRPEQRRAAAKPPPVPVVAYSLPGGYGAGGTVDSTLGASYSRIDVFPSASGRARAERSKRKAEEDEDAEMRRERDEAVRRAREAGLDPDAEDDDEREARQAIEALKRDERAKKRRVEQTGQQDLCARLFNFG